MRAGAGAPPPSAQATARQTGGTRLHAAHAPRTRHAGHTPATPVTHPPRRSHTRQSSCGLRCARHACLKRLHAAPRWHAHHLPEGVERRPRAAHVLAGVASRVRAPLALAQPDQVQSAAAHAPRSWRMAGMSRATSRPLTHARPPDAPSMPVRMEMSVVLPALQHTTSRQPRHARHASARTLP